MGWESVTLADISENIQTGPFGSQLHQSDYSEEGTPVVMPKDLIDGHISETSIARVDDSHVQRLLRHRIENGDILYSRRGDVGRCAIAGKREQGWLCGTGCLRVTINRNKANPQYIFYQLQKPETIGWVINHAVGATMLNLNTSIIGGIPIEIPSLIEQNRIVEILSTYDSLIENNQRQIKLLEEAAQRLYKEWFVDLRYPGHENVPVVDGVPEGWIKTTVGNSLTFHINGGWGKETPIGNNLVLGRVIRGTDINDVKMGHFSDIPLRFHTENDIIKKALRSEDIIFELSNGNINNIGRTLFVDNTILENCGSNTICASFCKLFRPKDKRYALTLYWEIQHMQISGNMLPYKKQGSNGINNFAFEEFLNHKYLVPCDLTLLKHIELIMEKMSNIRRQLGIISEARDRLLPKLMSGEIAV